MPIRPENRARYPDDWPQISARVREEAGQKCEWCDVSNGVLIRRATADDGRHVWRLLSDSAYEDGRYEDGSVAPDTGEDTCDWSDPVKVVLTVAHMDHRPENCARENLKALCQRCHNRYDAPMRRAGTAERAKAACVRAVEDGPDIWLPKSQCEILQTEPRRGHYVLLTTDEATATEKGLI